MCPRVVLVGLPGAGKSTIGKRLARALSTQFIDTDTMIEERQGKTCSDIFAEHGEAHFRQVEADTIAEALTSDGIVSLGGGAIVTPRTRDLLAQHNVVYLSISVDEGLRRTSGRTTRPLLNVPNPREKYQQLYDERHPLYQQSATRVVRGDGKEPHRVVAEILNLIDDD